jgi:hypothetical protein
MSVDTFRYRIEKYDLAVPAEKDRRDEP